MRKDILKRAQEIILELQELIDLAEDGQTVIDVEVVHLLTETEPSWTAKSAPSTMCGTEVSRYSEWTTYPNATSCAACKRVMGG